MSCVWRDIVGAICLVSPKLGYYYLYLGTIVLLLFYHHEKQEKLYDAGYQVPLYGLGIKRAIKSPPKQTFYRTYYST